MKTLTQYFKGIILGLFICLFLPCNAQQQISKTNTSAVISFDLADYMFLSSGVSEIITVPGKSFVTVEMQDDGYGTVADPGYPAIPQYSMYIHVPSNAKNIKVTIQNQSQAMLRLPAGTYIEPFVEYGVNGIEGEFYNSNYYATATNSYITENFFVSEPFLVMGEQAVCLTVLPFRYVPRTGEIQMLQHADFLVSWDQIGSEQKRANSTQVRESFLDNIFINYTETPKTGSQGRLLIITAPQWEDGLSPFSQYKENIGLEVQTVTTNTTGKSVDGIKNYIKNTAFDPDFVLLVGSPTDIPYTSGDPTSVNMDDPITDQGYRRQNGDDKIYGDVFLGRWPVSNGQDLANIINKNFLNGNHIRKFA